MKKSIITIIILLANFIINAQITADFTSIPVCLSEQSCFADVSTTDTCSVENWHWNFGDPSSGAFGTSTVQNPCHMYSAPGTYTVTLLVINCKGERDSITKLITVNPVPLAFFSSPDTSCISNNLCLIDSTFYNYFPPTKWQWDFGDSSPIDTTQNPCHTYSSTNTYTITLTSIDTNGCFSTYEKPIVVDYCTSIETYLLNNKHSVTFNPYNKIATITTNQVINNSIVKIYNSSGQVVHLLSNVFDNQVQINCNGIAMGIYFITIWENNKLLTTLQLPIIDN